MGVEGAGLYVHLVSSDLAEVKTAEHVPRPGRQRVEHVELGHREHKFLVVAPNLVPAGVELFRPDRVVM